MSTNINREFVSVVGILFTREKPKTAESLLVPFVTELQHILTHGIQYDDKNYRISVRAIVCDIPAVATVKQTKSHTGYAACHKCTVYGYKDPVLKEISFVVSKHNAMAAAKRGGTDLPYVPSKKAALKLSQLRKKGLMLNSRRKRNHEGTCNCKMMMPLLTLMLKMSLMYQYPQCEEHRKRQRIILCKT